MNTTGKSKLVSIATRITFGIISAWHQGKPLGINELSHEQLKINLRNLDYRFIELRSVFAYMSDEAEKRGEEKFLFVPEVNLYELMLLGNKYQQVVVLYKDKTRFELLDTDVGRVLSSFPIAFTNDEWQIAYSKYFLSRNKNISGLKFHSLEELHIPTLSDSLHQHSSGAGLAETEWIKIF